MENERFQHQLRPEQTTGEIQHGRERVDITPELLIDDNRSDRAQTNIEIFNRNKADGRLVYADICSDARAVAPLPNMTFDDRRIANAINPDIAAQIVNSNTVQWGLVSGHYDAILSQPGQIPVGCGGIGAKAEIVRNGTAGTHKDPLYEFIDKNLSEDPIANSLDYARALAARAEEGKRVLVAPQDHRSGMLKPVLWFEKRNGLVAAYFPPELKLPVHGTYDPKELYANGMPYMDLGQLPDDIAEYLEEYEKKRAVQYEKNPWLEDDKEIQDPQMLVFSTDLRSPKVWLPNTFRHPNSGFRLTVPRKRIDEHNVVIDAEDKHIAYSQAAYVLGHNVENADNEGSAFHSTNTVLAFKADFDRAVEFAQGLTEFEEQYAQAHGRQMWHALPGRQIIVGETKAGTITRIGTIDFVVKDGRVTKFDLNEHQFDSGLSA